MNLIQNMPTYQTCQNYCEHQARSCVLAYEEVDDSCAVQSTHQCWEMVVSDRTFEQMQEEPALTWDLLCQCGEKFCKIPCGSKTGSQILCKSSFFLCVSKLKVKYSFQIAKKIYFEDFHDCR